MLPSRDNTGGAEKCQHIPFLPCHISNMQIGFNVYFTENQTDCTFLRDAAFLLAGLGCGTGVRGASTPCDCLAL